MHPYHPILFVSDRDANCQWFEVVFDLRNKHGYVIRILQRIVHAKWKRYQSSITLNLENCVELFSYDIINIHDNKFDIHSYF